MQIRDQEMDVKYIQSLLCVVSKAKKECKTSSAPICEKKFSVNVVLRLIEDLK